MMSSGRLLVLLKVTVTCGLLAYIASQMDFRALAEIFGRIDWRCYLLALLVALLPIVMTSWRWQLLLRAQSIPLSPGYAISLGLSAQFFNAFLPGTTGGDAMRAYYAFKSYPREKMRLLLSLVCDRALGLFAFIAFAVVSLLRIDAMPEEITIYRQPAIWLGLASLAVAGCLTLYFALPSAFLPQRWRELLDRLQQRVIVGNIILFIRAQRRRPLSFLFVLLLTGVSCLSLFASGYLLSIALQLPVEFSQMVLAVSVVAMTTAVPISIGGHGVREVTLIGLLAPLGIVAYGDLATPVAFSLLMVSVQLFWGLVGGVWFLLGMRARARAIDPAGS